MRDTHAPQSLSHSLPLVFDLAGIHRGLGCLSAVAAAFLRSAPPLLAAAQHPRSDWLSFDNKRMDDWTAALIDATSCRYGLGAVLRSVTSILGRFFQTACVCAVYRFAVGKTQAHLLIEYIMQKIKDAVLGWQNVDSYQPEQCIVQINTLISRSR